MISIVFTDSFVVLMAYCMNGQHAFRVYFTLKMQIVYLIFGSEHVYDKKNTYKIVVIKSLIKIYLIIEKL